MIHLVVYDISNTRNRTKLARILERFGLERVQYSAFRGDLNPNDRDALIKKIRDFVRDEKDCIFVIPLCRRCLENAVVISNTGVKLIKEKKIDII